LNLRIAFLLRTTRNTALERMTLLNLKFPSARIQFIVYL